MPNRKKIAAIVSCYTRYSHADVIISKFIEGFPTDDGMRPARVDIASIYIDQHLKGEVGPEMLQRAGVPEFPSIHQAMTLGGTDLAVDGVLLIIEGGDYAFNELGHPLYPKRAFFEQICGVFAMTGKTVPVYVDKHFGHNWYDAQWIVDRAAELRVPLMAGSSLPYTWRSPFLEHPIGTPISEAAAIGFGSLEGYLIHDAEVLQCMVERRRGGETGIVAVQTVRGADVWSAAASGRWDRVVGEAAAHAIEKRPEGPIEDHCKEPTAVLIEYRDGLKAVILELNGYIAQWSYACRSEGNLLATEFYYQNEPPFATFSYMSLNVEEFLITGVSQAPPSRTLLTTGIVEAAVRSRFEGCRRIETPHLAIAYAPGGTAQWLPKSPRPDGACIQRV